MVLGTVDFLHGGGQIGGGAHAVVSNIDVRDFSRSRSIRRLVLVAKSMTLGRSNVNAWPLIGSVQLGID